MKYRSCFQEGLTSSTEETQVLQHLHDKGACVLSVCDSESGLLCDCVLGQQVEGS